MDLERLEALEFIKEHKEEVLRELQELELKEHKETVLGDLHEVRQLCLSAGKQEALEFLDLLESNTCSHRSFPLLAST